MDLLHSFTTGGATKELSDFVTWWVAPLFILFNVIGWLGLTQREANRSDPPPSDKDRSDLGRAIWRAWLVGILAALAGIWLTFTFCVPSLKSCSPPRWLIEICGAACALFGLALGVVRGVLPHHSRFRKLSSKSRRRILSSLVVCAVACSILCGALYYGEWTAPRNPIVLFYLPMLIGYSFTVVFEVGK